MLEGSSRRVAGRSAHREIRILFPNTAQFFGPPMQVHGQIIKHLDPQIHRVFVTTNSAGDSYEQFRRLPNAGVRTYNLGGTFQDKHNLFSKVIQILGNVPTAVSLLRIIWLIRKEKIEIIHCASEPRSALVGVLLSVLARTKLVIQTHAWNMDRGFLRTSVVAQAFSRADAVIADSHFIEERLVEIGVARAKICSIWPGVDTEAFHPGRDGAGIRREFGVPHDAPLIVTVGRITHQKGQKHLLEALVSVKRLVPGVRLLLVGWADPAKAASGKTYEDELKELCADHGLGDVVTFAGPRTDIPDVFAAADLVVVPSIGVDVCPLVVLEAMACGKSVIGTDSGGIPELIAEDTGILVPKASPEKLAEAIVRLLEQPELRQRQGRNARKRAEEHFYESRAAREVAKVYASVLRSGADAARDTLSVTH